MMKKRCDGCGAFLPVQVGRGPRMRYCSPACKQRVYRQRKDEIRNNSRYVFRSHLDLIYCAGDNERLTRMAYDAGFLIGIRSGRSSHGFPVHFVDIEYRRPNFDKHLQAVKRYQPKYATVLDLSEQEVSTQDIERALMQYEQLASYCQIPLIVPKRFGQIALLPPDVALGYSIPTSYGGAKDIKLWEFEGRRIHLLGGSPQKQLECYQTLSACAQVVSADGNMAQLMATQFAKYWETGRWVEHPQRGTNTPDIYLDCWKRSCSNIREEWGRLVHLSPSQLTLL